MFVCAPSHTVFSRASAVEATHFKPIEVFFRFDTDGNGKMDFEGFQGAVAAMHIEMPTGHALDAFEELDDCSASRQSPLEACLPAPHPQLCAPPLIEACVLFCRKRNPRD